MIWTDLIKVHISDLSCSVNDHVRSRSTQINNIKTYVCSSIFRFLWSVLYIIVCHFVLFLLLVIDLYALLWFTVSDVKQELLAPPEHISSPSVLSGVRVAQFLVFCVMFNRSLLVILSLFPLVIVLSILLWFTVSDIKQELLTLPEYMSSPTNCSGVRVAQSLGFCVVFIVDRYLPFCPFFFWPSLCCLSFFDLRLLITPLVSFDHHCVVCPSLIYGFWLPLWYL
jgi:hypothetical protein